jgi:hypothetical protein
MHNSSYHLSKICVVSIIKPFFLVSFKFVGLASVGTW